MFVLLKSYCALCVSNLLGNYAPLSLRSLGCLLDCLLKSSLRLHACESSSAQIINSRAILGLNRHARAVIRKLCFTTRIAAVVIAGHLSCCCDTTTTVKSPRWEMVAPKFVVGGKDYAVQRRVSWPGSVIQYSMIFPERKIIRYIFKPAPTPYTIRHL